jgi:erythrin-vacuolar iron transport family protein
MPLAPKTPAVFLCWLSLWLRLASAPLKSLSRGWIHSGLLGLMDGAVSTLAPIFAMAGLTGRPLSAFFAGLAAASVGLSALSDDGSVTGRGSSLRRGAITGFGAGLGGMLHTLPIPVSESGCRVVGELLTIAFIRYRFMGGKLANTVVQVILGSGIVFAIGVGLGRIGAG